MDVDSEGSSSSLTELSSSEEEPKKLLGLEVRIDNCAQTFAHSVNRNMCRLNHLPLCEAV
jgi:hypothetical protein